MRQHILNAIGAAIGAFLGFCFINTNAFVDFTWARWNREWIHIQGFNPFNFLVFALVVACLVGAIAFVVKRKS